MCSNVYNKTVIFVVIGVLTALTLVFLIIQTLRRIYKPARPRIKKTFVVQKKISQTPLTSRPVATEQCEITIENCCNMNICDTVSNFINYYNKKIFFSILLHKVFRFSFFSTKYF